MDPQEYINLIKTQQKVPSYKVQGICTRIIRIGHFSHRLKLSGDDPNRKIVFVSNAKASYSFIGKSGYECLIQIGYPKEWICDELLPPGPNHRDFELIVFPETSCVSATWDNFLNVIANVYPQVKRDCKKHAKKLISLGRQSRDKGWSYYNKMLGYDIDMQKKGMKTYMTLENYLTSPRDIAHFRAFLAHTCYANKYYSGDGWTHDENGERQSEEFVMADALIDDIDGVARYVMEVEAPMQVEPLMEVEATKLDIERNALWFCCIAY